MVEGRIFHLTDERVSAGLLRGAMRAGKREGERRRIVGLELAGDIMEARHGEPGRINLGIVLAGNRPAENDGQALPPEPVPKLGGACFYESIFIARAHVSFAGRGRKGALHSRVGMRT